MTWSKAYWVRMRIKTKRCYNGISRIAKIKIKMFILAHDNSIEVENGRYLGTTDREHLTLQIV
jgi:hypothetical protein